MKIAKHLIPLLLFCTLLSFKNIYCDDIYPGKTIYFIPAVQAGLTIPLSADNGPGGLLQSELTVRGLFLEMLSLSIGGEYRFHSYSESTSIHSGIGINGGYTFILPSGFSITPDAGFNLLIPISPVTEIFPELELGCRFNLHLYNRSKIYIETSFRLPFTDEQPPMLALSFGIKESNPIMLALPKVDPELTLSTALFSPDNDGENDVLNVKLITESPSSVKYWTMNILDKMNNSVVTRSGRGSPPLEFEWDGYSDVGNFVSSADDYTIEYIITDKIERSDTVSKNFVVDVLIFRIDGKLKINIANITFPPQSANFSALTDPEAIDKNNQILKRLSEIFKRFSEYSIQIEGHANSEHWQTAESFSVEQENELLPLSLSRAEKIRESLVLLGITGSRITVKGLGAGLPTVPFEDTINNWKNRRVEFILVK